MRKSTILKIVRKQIKGPALKERLCTPSHAERRNSCFFDGLDGHQNVAFELGRHPAHRLRSLRVTAPCNRTPPVTGSRASEGSRPLLVVGGGADLSGGGTCWGFTHAVPQRWARRGPSTPPRRDRGCQCPQAAAPPRRALGGQPWTHHNVVPCIAAAGGGPGTRRRAVVDRDVAGPGAACSRRAPPTPRARAAPVRRSTRPPPGAPFLSNGGGIRRWCHGCCTARRRAGHR